MSGADILTTKMNTGIIHLLLLLTSVSSSFSQEKITASKNLKVISSSNISEMQKLYTLKGTAACFLPDESKIITGSCIDNKTRVGNLDKISELRIFDQGGPFYGIVISPDGKLLVSLQFDDKIRIRDIKTGENFITLKGHKGGLLNAAFSQDGKLMVTGGMDRKIRFWDVNGWKLIKLTDAHSGPVFGLDFSSDGSLLASGGGHDDPSIKIWDIKSGKTIHTLKGCKADVHTVKFSPDDLFLASASRYLRIWDVKTGRELNELHGHNWTLYDACFSPDGSLLVTTSTDNTMIIWDMENRSPVRKIKFNTEITDMDFSRNGKMIAVSDANNETGIWGIPLK